MAREADPADALDQVYFGVWAALEDQGVRLRASTMPDNPDIAAKLPPNETPK